MKIGSAFKLLKDISPQIVAEIVGSSNVAGLFLGLNFYGSGNIGDDLMMKAFLSDLQTKETCRIAGLAYNAEGAKSQSLRFPTVRWYPYDGSLRQEKLFSLYKKGIWAGVGGTPYQMTCGTGALYFLNQKARTVSKFTHALMIGIGAESECLMHQDKIGESLSVIDRISTRDQHSADVLIKLGFPAKDIFAGADLANIVLENQKFPPLSERQYDLGVIPVADTFAPDRYFAPFIELLRRDGGLIAIPVNDIRKNPDLEKSIYAELIKNIPGAEERLVLSEPNYQSGTIEDLLIPISNCRTVISARYHGLLIAAWSGARVAAIARSSKVVALAKLLDIPYRCPPIDSNSLVDLSNEAVQISKDSLQTLAKEAHQAISYPLENILTI